MGKLEIILAVLGLVISAGIVRLLILVGYTKRIVEEHGEDIRSIKNNHLHGIYTRLGEVERSLDRLEARKG